MDSDDALTERLRALSEEWFECCGDIHEPLAEAADRIAALKREVEQVRQAGFDMLCLVDRCEFPATFDRLSALCGSAVMESLAIKDQSNEAKRG
jgi:hypothetical protein